MQSNSLFVFQFKPLWPKNGHWLGWEPGPATLEGHRQVRRRVLACLSIPASVLQVAARIFLQDADQLPLLASFALLLGLIALRTAMCRDLVQSRHLSYALLVFGYIVFPIINAIQVPVSKHAILRVAIRQCWRNCVCCIVQLILLGQMSFSFTSFILPSISIYVLRCFLHSDSLTGYWFDAKHSINREVICIVNSAGCILLFGVIWRFQMRRASSQNLVSAQTILSSRSMPTHGVIANFTSGQQIGRPQNYAGHQSVPGQTNEDNAHGARIDPCMRVYCEACSTPSFNEDTFDTCSSPAVPSVPAVSPASATSSWQIVQWREEQKRVRQLLKHSFEACTKIEVRQSVLGLYLLARGKAEVPPVVFMRILKYLGRGNVEEAFPWPAERVDCINLDMMTICDSESLSPRSTSSSPSFSSQGSLASLFRRFWSHVLSLQLESPDAT